MYCTATVKSTIDLQTSDVLYCMFHYYGAMNILRYAPACACVTLSSGDGGTVTALMV